METNRNTNFGKRRSHEDIQDEISQILADKSLDETLRRRIMNTPSKYRLAYARTFKSDGSKAKAMKMKCYECMGFESVVERIRNCGCKSCPLWHHRPFKPGQLDREEGGDDTELCTDEPIEG